MARRTKGKSSWGKGYLPDEYVRRHVVEILVNPLGGDQTKAQTDRWMVVSHRTGGIRAVEIEHAGQQMALPEKVIGQVVRDLDGMARQEKRDKARIRRDLKLRDLVDGGIGARA